jgi:hypothetical protein
MPRLAEPVVLQYGPAGAQEVIDVGKRATLHVGDFNGDGRLDLTIGALDGLIRVYLDGAETGLPEFEQEIVVTQSGEPLAVPSGRSSPSLADLNGDGLLDLLVGNTEGQLYFYANQGLSDAPQFGAGVPVVAAGEPIDLVGAPRSRPCVADFNADGAADVLVGAEDGLVRLYLGLPTTSDASPLALVDGDGQAVAIELNDHVLIIGAASWCSACRSFKEWTSAPDRPAALDELRLVFAFSDEGGDGPGGVLYGEFLESLPGEVVFIAKDSQAKPIAFPTVYDPGQGRFTQNAFEAVMSWVGADWPATVSDNAASQVAPAEGDGGEGPTINRQIYDCTFVGEGFGCYIDNCGSSYCMGRSEGQPERGPSPFEDTPYFGMTDVDDAYELVGQVQNYYWEKFGRNGANNLGGLAKPTSSDPTKTVISSL